MTREEARKHPDYLGAMEKIRGYSTGFKFTVNFAAINQISPAKMRGMLMLMQDAEKAGLVECEEMGFTLDGGLVEKTYTRTGVQ